MKPSGIITLTTDFGLSDPYVAMMKGVILTINPKVEMVDITHRIRVGDIQQAAEVLRDTSDYFPGGTVHLVVVDPGVGSKRRPIAIHNGSHFFSGPDNGVFSLIIRDDPPAAIVHLTEDRYFRPQVTETFHGRDLFAPVAAHLSLGVPVEEMGPVIHDPVRQEFPAPRREEGVLVGRIVHVDHFGNCITNIPENTLKRFLQSDCPVIELGALRMDGMQKTYSDVDEGRPLALINSSGRLEIAVNMGRASEYPGLGAGNVIGTAVKVRKA